ncbi:MAG: hypothetical protein D6797_09125 [Bdellovibrio sp.]|nr:MAG: hypothetical protein D6797_09125 [Bdellovibrio sp.]
MLKREAENMPASRRAQRPSFRESPFLPSQKFPSAELFCLACLQCATFCQFFEKAKAGLNAIEGLSDIGGV